MAGRPKTRARREAQARVKTRFDRVAREAILQRADAIGAKAAAAEAGVSMSTLRTWRRRAKAAAPIAKGTPPEDATSVDGLRRAAEKARASSARALETADSLLARGLASEGRNASVVASVFGDRARELEAAAQAAEAHAVALVQGRGEQVAEMVKAMFAAVDLAVPPEVARAVLRGDGVTPEIASAAREQVRAKFRAEVRAEILAEIEAGRLAQLALPAGEDEDAPEDAVEDAEVVDTPPVSAQRPDPRPRQPTKPPRYGGLSQPETTL